VHKARERRRGTCCSRTAFSGCAACTTLDLQMSTWRVSSTISAWFRPPRVNRKLYSGSSTLSSSNPPVRPAPNLASRPTGKLALMSSSPTPAKALAVPRPHRQSLTWDSHLVPFPRSRLSSLTRWLGISLQMPVPSTAIRSKGPSVSPRTALLTKPCSGFLFNPTPTHTLYVPEQDCSSCSS
jgi:hypothetical protein